MALMCGDKVIAAYSAVAVAAVIYLAACFVK
jgi:hypothetical protein